MQISTQEITLTINNRSVLDKVSLEANQGELLALVGPSGCGKTTLLNVLGLLTKPDSGFLYLDKKDITGWSDRKRLSFWQKSASFVFQEYGLIDEESIEYNVALSKLSFFGSTKKHRKDVNKALTKVGLANRNKTKVAILSGGEKQRVGLARAMFKKAQVILADEPTASLDLNNRNLVTGFLKAEADRGATVVVATHDETLMQNCDQTYELKGSGK